MNTQDTSAISRRTALAAIGAGGLGATLAARSTHAQDATSSPTAGHPIIGGWVGMVAIIPDAPPVPIPSIYSSDGQISIVWPVAGAGAQGVTFSSGAVGTWEPTSERGVHFTAVQLVTDANGVFTGTVTIDGNPTVSEDGQTILDDSPETKLTIRDALGTIVATVGGDGSFPPVTGYRMGPGVSGIPDSGATPTP